MNEEVSQRWQWLAMVLLLGALIWLLAPILTPFVMAALFAWLGDPLVDRLEAVGRRRTTAVLTVFGFMAMVGGIVMVLALPLLESQVSQLIDWLPNFADWLRLTAAPWFERRFKVDLAPYVQQEAIVGLLKEHWRQAGGVASNIIGGLSSSGLAIIAFFTNLTLIPVLTFFFLRDWDKMMAQLRELLPRPLEPTIMRLARESDAVLGGFLRGQLSVMLSLGAIYAVGLWFTGISFGLLIGFIAGLLSFVPYLGAIIGVTAAVMASLVTFGDAYHLAMVLMVFAVGQTIESFVLTPWLVGDRIGLHPVAVIFSIMAGGQMFGFLGVLLALPVAAVAMVMLRYAHERYRASSMYGAPRRVAGTDGAMLATPMAMPDSGDAPSVAADAILPAASAAPGADPGTGDFKPEDPGPRPEA